MGRLFSVKSETMKEIADAIREKTQKTKQIKTKDMANEIRGIPTGEKRSVGTFGNVIDNKIIGGRL